MKRTIFGTVRLLVILLVIATLVPSAAAKGGGGQAAPYQTGFIRWRAADNSFAAWTLSGVRINASGGLEFQQSTATAGTDPYAPGAYSGGNYYNGVHFL